jgi:hypothetical protein
VIQQATEKEKIRIQNAYRSFTSVRASVYDEVRGIGERGLAAGVIAAEGTLAGVHAPMLDQVARVAKTSTAYIA